MYVVYHKESTRYLYVRKPNGCTVTSYKTEGAAKAALTRAERDGKLGEHTEIEKVAPWKRTVTPYVKEDYAIAEAVDFAQNIEKTCMVTNLMSGKEVEETVNTPYYMSVSSNTYWSS